MALQTLGVESVLLQSAASGQDGSFSEGEFYINNGSLEGAMQLIVGK